jgi:hypothetical protein
MCGHVAYMGKKKAAYTILVQDPEGKKLLRIPMLGWEDDTNTGSVCVNVTLRCVCVTSCIINRVIFGCGGGGVNVKYVFSFSVRLLS